MTALYIASSQPYCGKSLILLVLGLNLKEKGKNIGYFKPIGLTPLKSEGLLTDEDALFIKHSLNLTEPSDSLAPIIFTPKLLEDALAGQAGNLEKKLRSAFSKISENKEVVLIDGAGCHCTGSALGLPPNRLAELLNAKVIFILKYESDIALDELLFASQMFSFRLIGTILNMVPSFKQYHLKDVVVPLLESKGIPVLGLIPRSELLSSISVRELTEGLNGKVLCCEDKLDELVEHFSVGAMNVDSALRYFRRIPNKAVITGGDRPDIQLAALETSTKCIILTGELYPTGVILARAEELGVPMIVVPDDTLTTVDKIDSLAGRLKVRDPKKIRIARELMEQTVDFQRLYALAEIKI